MDRGIGEMTPEQKALWAQYLREAGLDRSNQGEKSGILRQVDSDGQNTQQEEADH